jgi:hypothetical protein
MVPYGYTKEKLANYDETFGIARKGAEKLAQRHGTQYKIGNIAETIWIDSGSSTDWVKGVLKTRFVYAYELRDTGDFAFLLPSDQIVPNSEEVFDSMVEMLTRIHEIVEAEKKGAFSMAHSLPYIIFVIAVLAVIGLKR